MHVLLCEDDKQMYLHLEQVLNQEYIEDGECSVYIAKTGHQALYIAQNINIDIFIIDLDLPDMDGVDLAMNLRKTYEYQPIIIESSCDDLKLKAIIQDKISYYAFLTKPFDNEHFLAKFKNAVEISKHFAQQKLRLKDNRIFTVYDIQNIICIHKINASKKVEIFTYNKKLRKDTHYNSIKKIKENIVPFNSLVQVHKSYLVNPDYISQVNLNDAVIFLRHLNEAIPIGSKFRDNLQLFL